MGEDRIQIHIPSLHEEGTGVWARLATLDAGDSRGTVFRPEIEDEVIVGFLGGDPRSPVVLGMLHSSAKPSPLPGSDDNHEKGIFSRGEMKILFNDENNVLTIDTPNGNSLVMSEDEGSVTLKDENDNSFIMNADGITLESAADINITASGDINMSASGDLNMEGTNVAAAANAEFKAEGSSAAALESGGNLTINGSLVQIN